MLDTSSCASTSAQSALYGLVRDGATRNAVVTQKPAPSSLKARPVPSLAAPIQDGSAACQVSCRLARGKSGWL